MYRLALVAFLLVGCAAREVYIAKPLPAAEQTAAREQVRGFAKAYCGACHQSTLPTARPAALVIFDLDQAEWSQTLTPARLRGGFPRRLNARLDAADRAVLRRFIEAELALRGAAAS
jgi:hypothetical protein